MKAVLILMAMVFKTEKTIVLRKLGLLKIMDVLILMEMVLSTKMMNVLILQVLQN